MRAWHKLGITYGEERICHPPISQCRGTSVARSPTLILSRGLHFTAHDLWPYRSASQKAERALQGGGGARLRQGGGACLTSGRMPLYLILIQLIKLFLAISWSICLSFSIL